MIDEQNLFNKPVKSNLRTYNNIRKIATGQADDQRIGSLLGYLNFKNLYKMIVIDLSKDDNNRFK